MAARRTPTPAAAALFCAALLAPGTGRAAEPEAPPAALADARRRLGEALAAAARAEAERRGAEGDIDRLRADRAGLAAALVEAASRLRDAEDRAAASDARLDALTGRDRAIRAALAARRATVAEVLAALQRAGLHPPPALLASPGGALDAIRSSMLLGAAVPALRGEAASLAADLAELGRLRAAIAVERDAGRAEAAGLEAERGRLAGLVAARQAAQAAAEGALDGERRRAADSARQAADVGDLVTRLEAEARAAEADAAAVEARAALAGRGLARLAPALPFAEARGRLSPPVAGRTVRDFGAADSFGGAERGLSLAARAGAVVTAPADGWVSFAGPYRTYGQLLIVDLGGGYRMVLAGLGRLDVAAGQFVLAGEPVGAMGDGAAKTAAAIALGATEPVLYVELRHDGAAIDPAPWWAKAEAQKVRG